MKNIIFATDGSPCSEKASAAAIKLLNQYPDVHLLVFHVHPQHVYAVDGVMPIPDVVYEDAEVQDKAIDETVMKPFIPYGDRVTFKIANGSPAKEICDIANDGDFDLIMMGSHDKGAFDRFLMGSVTTDVLHHAHVSVLVVK